PHRGGYFPSIRAMPSYPRTPCLIGGPVLWSDCTRLSIGVFCGFSWIGCHHEPIAPDLDSNNAPHFDPCATFGPVLRCCSHCSVRRYGFLRGRSGAKGAQKEKSGCKRTSGHYRGYAPSSPSFFG